MKISLNWLKDYIEFGSDVSVEDIKWRLTEATAEIEHAHRLGEGLDQVVVGEIKEIKPHPDADKLSIAQVQVDAKTTLQIVFGQKAEVKVGDKVPTAIAPVELPGGKIDRGEIRGIMSEGMLCLDSELVAGASEGLTVFDDKAKVGTKVTELLPLEDVVFEVDNHSITHRPDLFSHYGFARECVALGLAKWSNPLKEEDAKKLVGKKENSLKVVIADDSISKNYYGTTISGLSTKPSPAWMQARLNAVGIRAINAIVDVTNYVMMDVGQPNHAFDLKALEGKTFTNRLSQPGEKVTTLDGIERELEENLIIGETEEGLIDLAGIMGGANSEIKDDTTDVYFHSAQFNNVMIRRAMISLGHRTDGGTMHEKNIEPERSYQGYVRGLQLFAEIFPEANFDHETIHLRGEQSSPEKIVLPFEKLTAYLGLEIDSKQAAAYLEDLGFEVKLKKDAFEVVPPSWRAQGVTIPEDVIEEIVRIHGLSKIPAVPPHVELKTPVRNEKRHRRRTLQGVLTGLGFQEEVNFSFLSEELLKKAEWQSPEALIELANPVSEDFRFMRPHFMAGLLNNLYRNQVAADQVWKTFEMGSVYTRAQDEVNEEHLLTLLVSVPQDEGAFFEAKGVLQSLMKELSLPVSLDADTLDRAYPNRCGRISSGEESLGHVYGVHPLLLQNFKLKGSVAAVEINLDVLYRLMAEDVLYERLNRNPEAKLDINVVVDEAVLMDDIATVLKSVEGKYLKHYRLVDLYQGENLGEGKKSFTFALSYQHPERTLEDTEIQDILEKLIAALEQSGGVVRR